MLKKIKIEKSFKNSNLTNMKNFKKSLILLICGLSLVNCSNSDSNLIEGISEVNPDLMSKITISKSTENVSTLFFNAGISSVNLEKHENVMFINANKNNLSKETYSKILLNGIETELSEFEIILRDQFISLSNDLQTKLTLVNNKPYIVTKDYSGLIGEKPELLENQNVLVLLMFLNEIVTSDTNKMLYQDQVSRREAPGYERPCSIWDTWYSVGVGLNESAAMSNFEYSNQNDLENDLVGCVALGGPESSSFGVLHYVTQSYCCS